MDEIHPMPGPSFAVLGPRQGSVNPLSPGCFKVVVIEFLQ